VRFSSVLVTGGAGFIGSRLVRELLGRGCSVVVLDNFVSGRVENLGGVVGDAGFRLVRGDVRDREVVGEALRGVEAVVHLAGLVDVVGSVERPLESFDVNVGGSLCVLDEAVKRGVGRFVFASSAAVYGDGSVLPLREDALPRPASPYAASKVCVEGYCRVFGECYGLGAVVLRYFNVYGSGMGDGFYGGVVSRFLRGGLRGEVLTVFGDGLQSRDFVFVGDVVGATVRALECGGVEGGVFNVCTGVPVSVNDLVGVVGGVVGRELRVVHAEARRGEVRHSYGDPGLAGERLGFRAETGLRDGLERVVKDLV